MEEKKQEIVRNDFLKMMPVEQAKKSYHEFAEFVKSILKKDLDYGEIPGTNKPSLYKPGAEKLRFVYAIGIEFEPIEAVVDYEKGIVDYTYRCTARSRTGQVLAQCEGNCNSREAKFGYLWKDESDLPEGTDKAGLISRTSGKKQSEFEFAIKKAETTGQYGKPEAYWKKWTDAISSGKAKQVKRKTKRGGDLSAWEIDESVTQYRIPNPDIIGMKNTIMKMAQKRAFVGAILIATGASEYFTQDVEDMDVSGFGDIYSDTHVVPDDVDKYPEQGIADHGDGDYVDFEEVKTAKTAVAGEWFARLEKCRTPKEVDDLAVLYTDEVVSNPALKKEFVARKKELRLAGKNGGN